MPLLEERHGRLLEEEGKGEKTKLKKDTERCKRQTNTEAIPVAKLYDVRAHTSHWNLKYMWPKDLSPMVREQGRVKHTSRELHCVCASLLLRHRMLWVSKFVHCSHHHLGEVIVFYCRGSRGLPYCLVQAGTVKANLEGINLPAAPGCHEATNWLFTLLPNIQRCCICGLFLHCSFRSWLPPDFAKYKFKTNRKLS